MDPFVRNTIRSVFRGNASYAIKVHRFEDAIKKRRIRELFDPKETPEGSIFWSQIEEEINGGLCE